MEDAQTVLREEVHRNHYQQVHSTTGEVPAIRFANAKKAGNNCFDRLCYRNSISRPRMFSA
jgi:hypothetical protein